MCPAVNLQGRTTWRCETPLLETLFTNTKRREISPVYKHTKKSAQENPIQLFTPQTKKNILERWSLQYQPEQCTVIGKILQNHLIQLHKVPFFPEKNEGIFRNQPLKMSNPPFHFLKLKCRVSCWKSTLSFPFRTHHTLGVFFWKNPPSLHSMACQRILKTLWRGQKVKTENAQKSSLWRCFFQPQISMIQLKTSFVEAMCHFLLSLCNLLGLGHGGVEHVELLAVLKVVVQPVVMLFKGDWLRNLCWAWYV